METTRSFTATGESIAAARQFVSSLVRNDDAALLASELVTNAVRYGSGDYDVTVRTVCDVARIIVTNPPSKGLVPKPRNPSPNEEGGRGLQLINSLALGWGYEQTKRGMEVWVEVASETVSP